MMYNFEELKKQLPYHYGRQIAANLDNISSEQVRLTFKGEITNPDIVEKVFREALELRNKLNKIEKLKKRAAAVK